MIIMMASFIRVSKLLVFHLSKCISAIKHILFYYSLPPCIYPHVLSCIYVSFVTVMPGLFKV